MALAVLCCNLVVDLLYTRLDPPHPLALKPEAQAVNGLLGARSPRKRLMTVSSAIVLLLAGSAPFAPLLAFGLGLMTFVAGLSFNLPGDGLRNGPDPRLHRMDSPS
jgi:hypothetical protein